MNVKKETLPVSVNSCLLIKTLQRQQLFKSLQLFNPVTSTLCLHGKYELLGRGNAVFKNSIKVFYEVFHIPGYLRVKS